MIPEADDYKVAKYKVDTSHENFIVVQPPSMPEDSPYDPYGQLSNMIAFDWAQFSPTGKVSALIVDTFSEAAEDVQRFVATAGRGNAGVGEIYGMDMTDAWGDDSFRTTQMNDYGKAQEMSIALLRRLNRAKQYPHVFVLGHRKAITQTTLKPTGKGKYKEMTEVIGYDMDIPGRKWLGNMTKFFEQYLWMTNDGVELMDIKLHLRSDGLYKTKLRSALDAPSTLDVPFSYKGQADVIREVARLSGVDMGSAEHGLRMCLYGEGGVGKTMLATSLPEETFAIGPAVYLTYDPSASRLSSTWPELRTLQAEAKENTKDE